MSIPFPSDFSAALAECVAFLRASDDALVPLSARRRLLHSMGPCRLQPGSKRAMITAGLERRTLLQIMSTEKVLPLWERKIGTDTPRRMLDLAQGYLAGRIEYDRAYAEQSSFRGGLANAGSLPVEDIGVSYVGHAAVEAVLTALMDADLIEDGCEDEDRDVYTSELCASELCACAAYSGDFGSFQTPVFH